MVVENYTPDNLLAGDDTITDSVTIASGQTVTRGAVLGKVTVGGEFVLSLTASTDGSQAPYAIAAEDIDASAGAVTNAAVYVRGEFNANALTLGTGHTVDTVKSALRDVSIFVKSTVAR